MKKLTVLLLCLLLSACVFPMEESVEISIAELPPWTGLPYVVLEGNVPDFQEADYTTYAYESYSPLDPLGRCGVAEACVGISLMPTEERGNIGQVKPSGWQTVKYDIVDGKYLYNRCHLIGYQLTGENANRENLITGTRYFNVEGMLPFENMVADYVKETGNHVLYRVTPLYEETELVARGVVMEGWSVEDTGEGICFHVFVYNAQPGIVIDYATGESYLSGEGTEVRYVLNTSTKRFHLPHCSGVADMKPENRQGYSGDRESLLEQGYNPCRTCNP